MVLGVKVIYRSLTLNTINLAENRIPAKPDSAFDHFTWQIKKREFLPVLLVGYPRFVMIFFIEVRGKVILYINLPGENDPNYFSTQGF